MKAIRVHAYGGPEEMKIEELPTPDPPPGHVLTQVKAACTNFFDSQLRSGLYKRGLPVALGVEGAEIVDRVAADVEGVKPGDLVV
jgi:NADPH:quinone reductase